MVAGNENVDFKMIEKSQVLKGNAPTASYGHGTKGFHIDNCELLYKVI